MEDEPIWMDFDKNDFVITLTPAINKKIIGGQERLC